VIEELRKKQKYQRNEEKELARKIFNENFKDNMNLIIKPKSIIKRPHIQFVDIESKEERKKGKKRSKPDGIKSNYQIPQEYKHSLVPYSLEDNQDDQDVQDDQDNQQSTDDINSVTMDDIISSDEDFIGPQKKIKKRNYQQYDEEE